MSKSNDKLERIKAELEFMKVSSAVKDRLIIEFITVLTAQKIVLPGHISAIIEKMYPGKLGILREIDKVIEASEKEKAQNGVIEHEQETDGIDRPKLRLVVAEKENGRGKAKTKK